MIKFKKDKFNYKLKHLMPKKRRNGGRSKKNRGHTRAVHCDHCKRLVGKDKAIKRYIFRIKKFRYHVKDMVDASS